MADTYVDEVVRMRAECSDCGWRGPIRKKYTTALNDEQDHNDEKHNPWNKADAEL